MRNSKLKKNIESMLPDTYKKSKVIKNASFTEDFGIVRSLWLEKSSFHPEGKQWYLKASVDFISDYCEIPDFQNHIAELSIHNDEVYSVENMRLINHWDEGEKTEIEQALNGILLPWLDSIGKPEIFADFLERSMVVGKDGSEVEHEAAFGDVLIQKQYDGNRVRQVKLEFLASIYGRIGQYEKAIEYLLKFQSFYKSDGSPNLNATERLAREEVLNRINKDILRFQNELVK
jgi:hypothetical protein